MNRLARWMLIGVVAAVSVGGCHAADDDAAGQARELDDNVRRQNAIRNITNIWSKALREANSDRSAPAVREVLDAVVEPMSNAYIAHRSDNQNAVAMLGLLNEMRDPRSLPALLAALDWRPEVNEDHAVRAAQTISALDVPEDKKAEVVAALSSALEKVRQARPIDNRMRIEMIRALGSLETREATPALARVAALQVEEQNFLINRLAAQELGKLEDPAAVDAMIVGLFLFAPSNPAMRMNDVAAESLVRIGRPSLEPLLRLLRGENEAANQMATAYIEAVRHRNAEAAAQMSVAQIIGEEATYALGSLGLADAFDALYAETSSEDMFRRVNGVIALVKLNHTEAQLAQVRERLRQIYGAAGDDFQGVAFKAQLIAAMRSLYDPSFLPFFLTQVRDARLHPQVRLEAVNAYALLANQSEIGAFNQWLERNTDDAYHENFTQQVGQAAEVAARCDMDLACYLEKMADSDVTVVRKASFMIGRLGRGNADAIARLTEKLGHNDLEVRTTAVQALDRIAVDGAPAAVARLEELRQVEESRAIWAQFRRTALPIAARLKARGGS